MRSKNANVVIFRDVPDEHKDLYLEDFDRRGYDILELPIDIIDRIETCKTVVIVTSSEEK